VYYTANCHIGSFIAIGPQSPCCVILDSFNTPEQILAQPVVSNCAVRSLDVGILLWIAGLNKVHSPALVDTLRYGQRLGFAQTIRSLGLILRVSFSRLRQSAICAPQASRLLPP
jgi:hypothetical protein